MRVAVAILFLFLMMVVGLQSCAVAFGGTLSNDEDLSGGGAIGMFVAFLFLIAGAFAVSFPGVSLCVFVLCFVMSLAVGVASDYSDVLFWAFVSLALSTMSFFGMREKKRTSRNTSSSNTSSSN